MRGLLDPQNKILLTTIKRLTIISIFIMKKIILFCLLTFFSFHISILAQDLPAFPGAEGWGQFTKGGRGGIVIKVTNLNDDGPGSFREAVMNPNPRIVVFEVSGTIELQKPLIITSPYLTIAGQTAPGDGICLKNYPLDILQTNDVIIRSIRIRPGIESGTLGSELDGIEVRESSNIIIDHCSISWSNDEAVNTWHKSSNVTVQWCMISEPLNKSIHEKGAHGFSASIGGYKTSFHHNLLANGSGRNPSIAGNNQHFTVLLDMRNCVISNWGHRTADGKPLSVNIINNYYKPGPATQDNVRRRIASIDNSTKMGFTGLWHIEGNYIEGYPEISADNWKGGVDFSEGTSVAQNRQVTPFEVANVTTQSAEEAYQLVLENVGCISPVRDQVDQRVIKQIKTNKYSITADGMIDAVDQVGGWPMLKQGKVLKDSDNDGMPDEWELAHGLNPNDANDANKDYNGDGYTNIEKYINSLIPNPYK